MSNQASLDVTVKPKSLYRWWPKYVPPAEVAGLGAGGTLFRDIVSAWVVVLPFMVPAVARATHIDALHVSIIPIVFTLWTLTSRVLQRSASPALSFYCVTAGNLAVNTSLAVAFPLLSHDPRSPIWCFAVVYTCINAAGVELGFSLGILLGHIFSILITIPIFLAMGADRTWSIAGPLLTAVACFIGYHVITNHTVASHILRIERDEARERLRQLEAERQTRHLAHELHDSVGSALSLAAMYGDIFEQADGETEVPRLAAGLRDSARAALTDLRGILGGVTLSSGTLPALAEAMRNAGARFEEVAGVRVDLDYPKHTDVDLEGSVRMAVLRVFQEATHNAVRHGAARQIDVSLGLDAGAMTLEVRDDGSGIPDGHRPGRGLLGMRQRALDLGGTLTIEPGNDGGTTVRFIVPVDASRVQIG